jgi:hypothetical protein
LLPSRHSTNKPTRFLILYQRQADADVTASWAWTRQMLRHFIEMDIAMGDLNQQLQRTLLPNVKAPHTGAFDDRSLVQIPQCGIFKPSHQKSSAEGIRLKAILPPV